MAGSEWDGESPDDLSSIFREAKHVSSFVSSVKMIRVDQWIGLRYLKEDVAVL